jgi:hypothetical protein
MGTNDGQIKRKVFLNSPHGNIFKALTKSFGQFKFVFTLLI